jgi:hypothetical protein
MGLDRFGENRHGAGMTTESHIGIAIICCIIIAS